MCLECWDTAGYNPGGKEEVDHICESAKPTHKEASGVKKANLFPYDAKYARTEVLREAIIS